MNRDAVLWTRSRRRRTRRGRALGQHYESWSHGVPQGVAILDQDLASDRDCVLQFLRADGSICRTSVTRLAGPTETMPLAWACLDGSCVGSDLSVCHSADNPLDRLVLFCDDSTEYQFNVLEGQLVRRAGASSKK